MDDMIGLRSHIAGLLSILLVKDELTAGGARPAQT
jgi:hypothetical protein